MLIFEKMQNTKEFSTTERQILEYLVEHQNELEKMTIKTLARQTFSSNATIIRMCHKFDFSGFRDFKIAFVKELENQKLITKSIDYSYPFQLEEPTSVIIQNMYSLFRECMDLVQTRLDGVILEKIAHTMERSKRTFFFGVGDTKLTIRSFINKGAKINFFPILATENEEAPYICKQMNYEDCAVFITYGGRHKSFEQYVQWLKKRHVEIIVLTSNPDCYLARNAKYSICIPDLEKQMKISTFYSQLVFQYILNLIYALLYRDHELDVKNVEIASNLNKKVHKNL